MTVDLRSLDLHIGGERREAICGRGRRRLWIYSCVGIGGGARRQGELTTGHQIARNGSRGLRHCFGSVPPVKQRNGTYSSNQVSDNINSSIRKFKGLHMYINP
jgi:hypothetical protein